MSKCVNADICILFFFLAAWGGWGWGSLSEWGKNNKLKNSHRATRPKNWIWTFVSQIKSIISFAQRGSASCWPTAGLGYGLKIVQWTGGPCKYISIVGHVATASCIGINWAWNRPWNSKEFPFWATATMLSCALWMERRDGHRNMMFVIGLLCLWGRLQI